MTLCTLRCAERCRAVTHPQSFSPFASLAVAVFDAARIDPSAAQTKRSTTALRTRPY
jgi:hypothetical protein